MDFWVFVLYSEFDSTSAYQRPHGFLGERGIIIRGRRRRGIMQFIIVTSQRYWPEEPDVVLEFLLREVCGEQLGKFVLLKLLKCTTSTSLRGLTSITAGHWHLCLNFVTIWGGSFLLSSSSSFQGIVYLAAGGSRWLFWQGFLSLKRFHSASLEPSVSRLWSVSQVRDLVRSQTSDLLQTSAWISALLSHTGPKQTQNVRRTEVRASPAQPQLVSRCFVSRNPWCRPTLQSSIKTVAKSHTSWQEQGSLWILKVTSCCLQPDAQQLFAWNQKLLKAEDDCQVFTVRSGAVKRLKSFATGL